MSKFKLYSFRAGGLVAMPIGSKEENKKSKETIVLDCFLSTKIGQTWYSRNKFVNRQDCEEPDFIFIDANNQTHGLELVQFVRPGGDWQQINRTMQHIVEQVHAYFLKQNKNIGLVVDAINKEHLQTISLVRRYSGITTLEEKPESIKNKIIKAIETEMAANKTFVRTSIDLGSHWLRISASTSFDTELRPTFNCERMYFDLQPEHIQNLITKKNALLDRYLHKCDKCSLLVVVDNENNCFSPMTITQSVLNNQYASKFENLFLVCIDGDSSKGYKLRKLQTTKPSKPLSRI